MKKIIRTVIIAIIIYILLGIAFGVKTITKVYTVESEKIQTQINIIQVSDFHSQSDYEETLYQVKSQNIDIIALTGDIYTSSEEYTSTLEFVKELNELAPVFYVNGNHDSTTQNYKEFINEIEKLGVTVLSDTYEDIVINNQEIRIIGILDNPYSTLYKENYKDSESITKTLEENLDEEKYNIVLSHRPQYFEEYTASGADLVLSGHTHGGIIRFPVVNAGAVIPDQGFLAKYDYGMFEEENTTMIISSGVATSYNIPRIYNPKEIVKIEVK